MSHFQDKVVATFLDRLKVSPEVSPDMIDLLRKLLSNAGRKPKADDFVNIFVAPREDVK